MNDRNEAVQALNIALAYTGPGAARERMLHDAAAQARRVLLADDVEVSRLTECLEAMNASADILDEKIRVLSAFVERTGLTSVYGRLDAHEVDELNAILAAATPNTHPTGQE